MPPPSLPYWLRRSVRLVGSVTRMAVILAGAFAPGQLPPPPKPRREPQVQVAGESEESEQR